MAFETKNVIFAFLALYWLKTDIKIHTSEVTALPEVYLSELGKLDRYCYWVHKYITKNSKRNSTSGNIRNATGSGSVSTLSHSKHTDEEVVQNSSIVTFKKCCPLGYKVHKQVINGVPMFNCVDSPLEWQPAIFSGTNDAYSQHKHFSDFENVSVTFGFPHCDGLTHSLNNSMDTWFMVQATGFVRIGLKFWFEPVWLTPGNEHCFDEFVDYDAFPPNHTNTESHKMFHRNQIIIYCRIDGYDEYLLHRKILAAMCLATAGVVFIILLIYLAIWNKQNLAGWTQFNIFVAIFLVMLFAGGRTFHTINPFEVRSNVGCIIVALVAQYFFFALNAAWTVMCFDLFRMFRKLRAPTTKLGSYRNRLILYLLFSWGLSLVVVILQVYFTYEKVKTELNGMIGVYAFAHRRCTSPIRRLGFQTQLVLTMINLIFFIITTLLIWYHRRTCNSATKNSKLERKIWKYVVLFTRLIMVMGIWYSTTPIDYFFFSSMPISITALFFRTLHFIPFLALLFIFGFNRKNTALIKQKYPKFGKRFGILACSRKSSFHVNR